MFSFIALTLLLVFSLVKSQSLHGLFYKNTTTNEFKSISPLKLIVNVTIIKNTAKINKTYWFVNPNNHKISPNFTFVVPDKAVFY